MLKELYRLALRFSNFGVMALSSIGQKRLILVLSGIVGVLSGLAAVVLKNTVHFTHTLLERLMEQGEFILLYFALPGIGILLTLIFVRYVVKDNISHGVTRILYAISRKSSKIKRHNTFSSIISSTITIGFGGSVGAEAPIVLTGSAIGSNIGQMFKLNYKTMTLLLACGSAAAIASIFKAPLAGVLFTLEVLMLDLTMASIVPLLIAAVTGTTISYFLMGKDVVFAYEVLNPFALNKIPYFIILGIFCGLVSLYFTRVAMKVEGSFSRTRSPYLRWIIGASLLGLLIFLFPPLYGEGYDTLQNLLNATPENLFKNSIFSSVQDNQWILLGLLGLLIAFKVFAMAITTGAGGIGGTFAPTLFVGGISGFFVGKILNLAFNTNLSESNFALVGMAGTMAGVMHAPLTAIFLIAELTGGYDLFIPLMITSTMAYITIISFEPHSIYTKRLAARGDLITHHKDQAVLTLLKLGNVIETDFTVTHPEETLGQLVKTVSKSRRNIFPVVAHDGFLMGIVLLDDIRQVMFETEKYNNTFVRELLSIPPDVISIEEPMNSVIQKFEETGAWNIPVVDNGNYVGFVSKAKIFSAYRNMLVQFSDE
jgi:chloride channel protein, CIC family